MPPDPQVSEEAVEAAAKSLFDLVWAKSPGMSRVPHPDKPDFSNVEEWFKAQARAALEAAAPFMLADAEHELNAYAEALPEAHDRVDAAEAEVTRLRSQLEAVRALADEGDIVAPVDLYEILDGSTETREAE